MTTDTTGGSNYLDYHRHDINLLHNEWHGHMQEKLGADWMDNKTSFYHYIYKTFSQKDAEFLEETVNLSADELYAQQNENECFHAIRAMMRLVGYIQKQGVGFVPHGIDK